MRRHPGAHLFESYGMIPQKNEVGKAKVFGVHNISSTLYFSSGDHVLKSFNTVNFTENPEVFTFPKDEKITFIGHIDYNEYSDPSGKGMSGCVDEYHYPLEAILF